MIEGFPESLCTAMNDSVSTPESQSPAVPATAPGAAHDAGAAASTATAASAASAASAAGAATDAGAPIAVEGGAQGELGASTGRADAPGASGKSRRGGRGRRGAGGPGGAAGAGGHSGAGAPSAEADGKPASAAKAPRGPRPIPPTLDKLAELYPQHFGAVFLPLKRGIFQDLLAAHPEVFERDALKLALGIHTRSTRYLQSVAAGQPRHDLQGQRVEDMAPEHVHQALLEVHRRRQGRGTEDLLPKLRNRMMAAFEASGLTREAYTELVQGRDEAANALLEEAFAEWSARNAKDEALLRAFEASGQTLEAFADMYGMVARTVGQQLERARRLIETMEQAQLAAAAATARNAEDAAVAVPRVAPLVADSDEANDGRQAVAAGDTPADPSVAEAPTAATPDTPDISDAPDTAVGNTPDAHPPK